MKKITKVLVSGLCVVSMLGLSSCAIVDKIKGLFGGGEKPEVSIFDGNYQAVEQTVVEEFAVNTSEDAVSEIFLNSKGTIGKNYSKSINYEGDKKSSSYEVTTDIKISREGLSAAAPYKAERKTIDKNKEGDSISEKTRFFYDNGQDMYTSYGTEKVRTKSDGFENLVENLELGSSMFNPYAIKDFFAANTLDELQGVEFYTDIAWQMDSTDEEYIKLKVTCGINYALLVGGVGAEIDAEYEKNQIVYTWVYNKSNKCVAFFSELDVKMVLFMQGQSMKTDAIGQNYIKPWEGKVEAPTDLESYKEESASIGK